MNQRDQVITDGGELAFRSRFNYHGFRYVRVTGLEKSPTLKDTKGYFIHT
jgi:alpha-L-rhamnosidase